MKHKASKHNVSRRTRPTRKWQVPIRLLLYVGSILTALLAIHMLVVLTTSKGFDALAGDLIGRELFLFLPIPLFGDLISWASQSSHFAIMGILLVSSVSMFVVARRIRIPGRYWKWNKYGIRSLLLFALVLVGISIIILFTGSTAIAEVDHISCGVLCQYGEAGVILIPKNAEANTQYKVELWEGNKLRGTTTISWNQPQIKTQYSKTVCFPLTLEEYRAYSLTSGRDRDLRYIFDIKIHRK